MREKIVRVISNMYDVIVRATSHHTARILHAVTWLRTRPKSTSGQKSRTIQPFACQLYATRTRKPRIAERLVFITKQDVYCTKHVLRNWHGSTFGSTFIFVILSRCKPVNEALCRVKSRIEKLCCPDFENSSSALSARVEYSFLLSFAIFYLLNLMRKRFPLAFFAIFHDDMIKC